nr:MAG TPA: hypothetical protein [Caudoviricetes sp.]DAP47854.1 MAG TPA: hypothetical protein [Caudoviricetes sp.]
MALFCCIKIRNCRLLSVLINLETKKDGDK